MVQISWFKQQHFWLIDDFFPTLTLSKSYVYNQNNYKNRVNKAIYT